MTDKLYNFTVAIVRIENNLHYYEVEAKNEAEAKRMAHELHDSDQMAEGKCVHAEEWVHEVDCDDPEYDWCDDEEEEETND